MGNSNSWEERGPTGPRDGMTQSSLRFFDAWVPTGPQPGVGPGGQGEVGLPRKCCTMFRGAPGRGFPEGLPFPPPSPQEDESTST